MRARALLACLVCSAVPASLLAQSTVFTYQGTLKNGGVPATDFVILIHSIILNESSDQPLNSVAVGPR